MFRERRKYFAIKLNICFFQPRDHFAVRSSVEARTGINFYVPKRAEVSFFLSAVVKRMRIGV